MGNDASYFDGECKLIDNTYKLIVIDRVIGGITPGSEPVLAVRVERQVAFGLTGNRQDAVADNSRLHFGESGSSVVCFEAANRTGSTLLILCLHNVQQRDTDLSIDLK